MIKMIKFYIQESWLLLTAAILFGLTLAGLNAAWKEDIDNNRLAKFNNKAALLLPDAVTFNIEEFDSKQTIDIKTGKGPVPTELKKCLDAEGNLIGWAFIAEGSGFGGTIKLVVATDPKFEKVKGFGVLETSETPNFGDKIAHPFFNGQFKGLPVGDLVLAKVGDETKIDDNEIIAITGATISSDAVIKIFNGFLPEIQKQLKAKGKI